MIELYDNEVLLCSDWLQEEKDAIYFRPLNTKDQIKSNQLHHRATVQKMGIPYTERLFEFLLIFCDYRKKSKINC